MSVVDADDCRTLIHWSGVLQVSCMLLSAWTEYHGTSLFGGSLLYNERQAERIVHAPVLTRSRDLRPRTGVKSKGPWMYVDV